MAGSRGAVPENVLEAKAILAKRHHRERQVKDRPEPAAVEQDPWNDLQPLLDQELAWWLTAYPLLSRNQ